MNFLKSWNAVGSTLFFDVCITCFSYLHGNKFNTLPGSILVGTTVEKLWVYHWCLSKVCLSPIGIRPENKTYLMHKPQEVEKHYCISWCNRVVVASSISVPPCTVELDYKVVSCTTTFSLEADQTKLQQYSAWIFAVGIYVFELAILYQSNTDKLRFSFTHSMIFCEKNFCRE